MNAALRWFLALSVGAFAAASLAGCVGQVTGGGSGGDGGAGAGGDDGNGGEGGVAIVTTDSGSDEPGSTGNTGPGTTGGGGEGGFAFGAIAMNHAQLQGSGTGGSGGSGSGQGSTGVGGGPAPGTQYLLYGAENELPTCSEPFGSGGCGGWSVSITVPPALFHPGIASFQAGGAEISFSESQSEGNGICSGSGGGGIEQGQIEIHDITATTVEFTVSGVDPGFSFNANGTYVANRCQ